MPEQQEVVERMMNPIASPGTDAFVSTEELANPPSCTEAENPIDRDSENSLRVFGCELIQLIKQGACS